MDGSNTSVASAPLIICIQHIRGFRAVGCSFLHHAICFGTICHIQIHLTGWFAKFLAYPAAEIIGKIVRIVASLYQLSGSFFLVFGLFIHRNDTSGVAAVGCHLFHGFLSTLSPVFVKHLRDVQIEEKEYRQCKEQQCSNPKSQLQIAQKPDLLFNILCLPHY